MGRGRRKSTCGDCASCLNPRNKKRCERVAATTVASLAMTLSSADVPPVASPASPVAAAAARDDIFASVPTLPGFVGVFKLLEAAMPQSRRKGSAVWKRAVDAGKPLPEASLMAIPGCRQKTRAAAVAQTLEALEGAVPAADFAKLFEEDGKKASLIDLLVRGGVAEEEAEGMLALAEARVVEQSEEKLAILAELAQLLGRDGAGLKLRCRRVHGSWIFSRYDSMALMLEPEHRDQAPKIWERMLAEHPELSGPEVLTAGQDRGATRTFKFAGDGQRETPVADIRGTVEMLLLVPGRRAAAFRRAVASVFVRCCGGDPLLVEDMEKAAHVQRFLRAHSPEHPATAFGEACGDVRRGAESEAFERAHKRRMLELDYERARALLSEDVRAKKAEADVLELAVRRGHEEAEAAAARRAAEEEAAVERRAAELDAARRVAEADAAAAEDRRRAAATRLLEEGHEAFRRDRAATIAANLGALRLLRGDGTALSPRSLRVVEDELRTGLLGQERPDIALGRPVYLTGFLRKRLQLKEAAAQQRAAVFGRVVRDAVRAAHPEYEPEAVSRSVAGRDRPVNLYYEAHLDAIEAALTKHLVATPLRDEELTSAGLEQQRRRGQARPSVDAMLRAAQECR